MRRLLLTALCFSPLLPSDDEIKFTPDVAGIAMEKLTAKRKF